MIYKRNRLLYSFMIIVVIFLGICSKKMSNFMPEFLNSYLGDVLWALMIFIGFALIFCTMERKKVALLGMLFCCLVELSQLYHANWIDRIRETKLGGLVLGYTFSWMDFLAYAIGIVTGLIIENLYASIRSKK